MHDTLDNILRWQKWHLRDNKLYVSFWWPINIRLCIVGVVMLVLDGLVPERRNPSAVAMEFLLSCIDPSLKSSRKFTDVLCSILFSGDAGYWYCNDNSFAT